MRMQLQFIRTGKAIRRILTVTVLFMTVFLAACTGDTTATTATGATTTATTGAVTTVTTSATTTEEITTNTQIVLYDGPAILTSSNIVDIFVEDREVFVYETLVNYGRTFTYTPVETTVPVAIWDFEGSITVTIVVTGDIEVTSAKVTPQVYGITPTVSGGDTISFTLEYPGSYTVEYNDDYHNAVHLFTNTIEEETYDPDNLPADVIYIGPGVYKADSIPVASNQTIYIAGGAVVYGKIRTENLENITITGRGIIDGSIYKRTMASEYTIPIEIRHSQNITIEGITFLNPAGWCMAIYFSEDVDINHVNIVTARANGDGISIQSSQNVTVRNSFLRTWDDALVVKNYDLGTTNNVTFDNIVIWTDLAQSMEIGYETYGASMTNIAFSNITVLHNFHKPVISIHNSDQADIANVSFRNITVEDAQMIGDNAALTTDDFLIEIFIRYNQNWSRSIDQRGTISNIVIDNLVVLDGKDDIISLINGYDGTHAVTGVTLSNIKIKGEPVESVSDLSMTTNEYVSGLTFAYDEAQAVGAPAYHPYELNLPAIDEPDIMTVANIAQDGFLVPAFARAEAVSSYMGQKVTGIVAAASTRGTASDIYDDGSGSHDLLAGGAASVFDGDPLTMWESVDFVGDGTYYALSITFDEAKAIGTIRLYGDLLSEIFQIQTISVYGIKATSTNNVYTKISPSKAYEFSPASGNVVDLKITANNFKAIQLRFYAVTEPACAEQAFLSEVEFYPASLSFQKAVTASTHEDVYTANYLVDGNPNTYYESKKDIFPAQIVIDLGAVFAIRYISVYLPPKWENRTQTIEILTSIDGVEYSVLAVAADYVFATALSNVIELILDPATNARYVKFVITGNTSGYGAQFSEINIFS
ncbi:MAG: discoidin domain-containing protein [bacterium]